MEFSDSPLLRSKVPSNGNEGSGVHTDEPVNIPNLPLHYLKGGIRLTLNTNHRGK